MKLLIIGERYWPEARSVSVILQDLAEALVNRGHYVTVLTKSPTKDYMPHGNGGNVKREEVVHGVSVVRTGGFLKHHRSVPMRMLEQGILTFKFLHRALGLPRHDIVLFYSPPLFLAIIAIALKKFRGMPFVVNLHDLYPRTAIELGVLKNPFIIWLAKFLERKMYHHARGFSVPFWGNERYLIEDQHLPREKVHMIFNWVDTNAVVPGPKHNAFRQKYNSGDAVIVSYAGVMGWAQDLTAVMECARQLEGSRPDIKFVLIGEEPLSPKTVPYIPVL